MARKSEPVTEKTKYRMVGREAFAKIAIGVYQAKEELERSPQTSASLATALTDRLGMYVHPTTAAKAASVVGVSLLPTLAPAADVKRLQELVRELEARLAAAETFAMPPPGPFDAHQEYVVAQQENALQAG